MTSLNPINTAYTNRDYPNLSTARRRTQRRFLESIFESYGSLSNNFPKMKQLRDKIQIVGNIPYHASAGPDRMLDVYSLKAAKKPMPVMIYIHGGGFVMCSKETHRNVAMINASMGHLVFNINYRLAPAYPFPAAIEDVCQAYAWIVKRAHLFNGDINRLSLAGESAGGNLVLGLTVASCYRREEPYANRVWRTGIVPKAVQVHAGLLQVSRPDRFRAMPQAKIKGLGPLSVDIAQSVAMAYLREGAFQSSPVDIMADPLNIIESPTSPDRPLPPLFGAVGTADICLDDTRRLEAALRQKKAPHTINYYTNQIHAFHFLFWRRQAKQFWNDSHAFLNTHV